MDYKANKVAVITGHGEHDPKGCRPSQAMYHVRQRHPGEFEVCRRVVRQGMMWRCLGWVCALSEGAEVWPSHGLGGQQSLVDSVDEGVEMLVRRFEARGLS